MSEYWIWKKDAPIAGPFPTWQAAKEFKFAQKVRGGVSIHEHKDTVRLAKGPWRAERAAVAAA